MPHVFNGAPMTDDATLEALLTCTHGRWLGQEPFGLCGSCLRTALRAAEVRTWRAAAEWVRRAGVQEDEHAVVHQDCRMHGYRLARGAFAAEIAYALDAKAEGPHKTPLPRTDDMRAPV